MKDEIRQILIDSGTDMNAAVQAIADLYDSQPVDPVRAMAQGVENDGYSFSVPDQKTFYADVTTGLCCNHCTSDNCQHVQAVKLWKAAQ